MARGDIEVKNATNAPIICVKWVDNKSAHLISSCDNGMSFTNVKRRKKGQSNKIAIKCPTLIKTYNENMGGIDRHDRLKVAYEVDRRNQNSILLANCFRYVRSTPRKCKHFQKNAISRISIKCNQGTV